MPDVGIELGAACMPSELASDRATAPGRVGSQGRLPNPLTVHCVATVSKNFKINLEGQNYMHFYLILSRNVKIFGIIASL